APVIGRRGVLVAESKEAAGHIWLSSIGTPFRELRSMHEAMDRFFQEPWARPMSQLHSEWAGSIPVEASEIATGVCWRCSAGDDSWGPPRGHSAQRSR